MKFMFLSRSHFTELFFLNRTEECVIKKERSKSKQQKGEKEDFEGKTQTLSHVDL